MFRFERLRVWHKAVELFDVVDQLCDSLPVRVRRSLGDQWRRAALSVSSNIGEGVGRDAVKESRHFFSVSRASVFEVVSISFVCRRRKYLSPEQWSALYEQAEEISKMLTGLKGVPAH